MIISPRVKGFICLTAHPEGCKDNIRQQIDWVKQNFEGKLKSVLVIGGTTGYGLASALVAAFGCQAKVLVVGYDKQAANGRTATAGLYNTAAFLQFAQDSGLFAKAVCGDAFGDKCKVAVGDIVERDMGPLDLIIYSLASPKRLHPKTGQLHQSVLKPLSNAYTSKNLNVDLEVVDTVTLQPATEQEKLDTIQVMGGDDWMLWIEYLYSRKLIANNAKTIAYSYIGPELTHAIYKDGTIGQAKNHLKQSADKLGVQFGDIGLKAFVSIQKALVTQASSAIPVVPLYISLMYSIMKKLKTHEDCIQQIVRLFEKLQTNIEVDQQGYIRLDDWEMDPVVQAEIDKRWHNINTDNLHELADVAGYKADFLKLFGFGCSGVDYDREYDEKANETGISFCY